MKRFQRHHALPVTGVVDLSTWLSLLVSCGDTGRRGTACDTRFEITAAHLATLISYGYKYVGRYLTGGDFKQIRDGELDRIINGGLSVFPIFEEGGYKLSYFTAAQGTKDAATAAAAARRLRIPPNSVIYFAVDFDALDSDVTSNILPYFHALHTAMKDYRIGVYGPRNVCLRTGSSGYSVSSFVADMSSGFSGNMGYRLPDDWAFDQISNTVLKHSSDSVEIDNNIASGLAASCSVNRLSTSLDMKPTVNVPFIKEVKLLYPKINRWSSPVPVFREINSTEVLTYIQPNEGYLYGAKDDEYRTYQIVTSDGNGGLLNGWYQETNLDVPTIENDDKEWVPYQEAFIDWNVNGSELVQSSGRSTVINGTSYRVFTLRYDAQWITNNNEEGGIVPAGTQVAAIVGEPMKEKNSAYLPCYYWGAADNGQWFQFNRNGVQKVGYIDFGIQYGLTPNNRLLM